MSKEDERPRHFLHRSPARPELIKLLEESAERVRNMSDEEREEMIRQQCKVAPARPGEFGGNKVFPPENMEVGNNGKLCFRDPAPDAARAPQFTEVKLNNAYDDAPFFYKEIRSHRVLGRSFHDVPNRHGSTEIHNPQKEGLCSVSPATEKKDPVLIVVGTHRDAERLQRVLDPRFVKVLGPSSPVMGNRFSAILITRAAREYGEPSRVARDNFDRWLNESLRCRLPPDCADNIFNI